MRPSLIATAIALSLYAIGCADDQETTSAASPALDCGPGTPRSFVITNLGFTRVDPETQAAPGFDVDGVVSDGSDAASCYKKDFTSPEGTPGIDNQLAALIPDVEAILGNAVDGLIQGAINNGDLLIVLDVTGADNLQDDPCVDLTVRTVLGKPTLGTDGVIEAYQTYDPDPEGEVSRATQGKIEDGVLTIGPFELAIPIAIFDVAFTIHVHDALVRLGVGAEDGIPKEGMLGGGVVGQEIIDGVKDGAGVYKYIPVLTVVMKGSTDLARDAEGTCQQISAGLRITAAEAFVRE
jgi:hypothetical protein